MNGEKTPRARSTMIVVRAIYGRVRSDAMAGRSVKAVTIFFTAARQFNEPKSDDGAFGSNHLFHGDGGSIAITFEAP